MPGFLRRPLMRSRVLLAAALVGVCACLSGPVLAQPAEPGADRVPGLPEPSIATSLPRALADPAGVRSALGRRGVIFGVNYIGEVLANPTGGYAQGAFYDGRLELAVQADLEKALGWSGLSFFVNAYQIHGDSISASDLGVLMPVSFIEADPATRLFELWLEQKFYDDKVSIRFGQLAADSEFMLSQGGQAFLNGTWGWPSITAMNMPQNGPAYPLATPGVRLAVKPTDDLTAMIGVFNGKPAGDCRPEQDPQICNPDGVLFPLNFPPLLMAEVAYRYNQGQGELPGVIKIGAYRNFGEYQFQHIITGGVQVTFVHEQQTETDGDFGLYAVLDQMLYRLPGGGDPRGISIFGRVIGAPEHNLSNIYWEAGLTFAGLSSARPDDTFAIGFARTGISPEISSAQEALNRPVIASFEAMVEASYMAEIVPGFVVQPDFQYFWNPGGHVHEPDNLQKAVPDAAVFGLRTTINY